MDYLLSLLVGFVLVGLILLIVFRSSRKKPFPHNHEMEQEDAETAVEESSHMKS